MWAWPGCSSWWTTIPLAAEDTTSPYSVSWNTATVANGTHTLTAVARDAAGNTATSAPVAITVANAGTTAPTVAITAPSGTVSGVVTISANASDNVGVAGVQFLVDNNPVAAEDTASPYSVSWNTTTVANGTHTLTARRPRRHRQHRNLGAGDHHRRQRRRVSRRLLCR